MSRRQYLKTFLLAIGSFCWLLSASAQGVLQGQCEWKVYRADGTVSSTQTYLFSIYLEGLMYRIEIEPKEHDDYYKEVVGSDGVDNFLHRTQQNPVSSNQRAVTVGSGMVAPGLYPSKAAPPSQIAWLGIFGNQYFTNHIDTRPLQMTCVSYTANTGGTNIISRTNDATHDLTSIVFLAPGIMVSRNAEGASSTPCWAPYDHGYKAWEVIVPQWTNIGALRFPSTFKFQQYYPKQPAEARDKNDLRLIRSAVYQVTNAQASAKPDSFLPVLPAKWLMVLDFRLGDAIEPDRAAFYHIEDGKWKSKDDPLAKEKIGIAKRVNSKAITPGAKPEPL